MDEAIYFILGISVAIGAVSMIVVKSAIEGTKRSKH